MRRTSLLAAVTLALALAFSGDGDTPRAIASHTPNDMMSIRHSGGDPGPYGGGTVLNVAVAGTFTAELWVDASSAPYDGYVFTLLYDPAYVAFTGTQNGLSPRHTLCDNGDTNPYGSLMTYYAGCVTSGPGYQQFVGHIHNVQFECTAATPGVDVSPIAMIAMDPSEDQVTDPSFGASLLAGVVVPTSTRYKGPHLVGGMSAQITVRCLEPQLDPDNDGCSNGEETGPNQLAGGKRDPFDGNDFFDVPAPALKASMPNGVRNKAVGLIDVGAVLSFVGATNDGMPNPNGYDYDTDFNSNSIDDGAEYDRTPSMIAGQLWRSGPPNGAVSLMDVGVSLSQVGTNCVPPP